LFIDIAETYIDKEKVRKRWAEWLAYEAEVMTHIELRQRQNSLTRNKDQGNRIRDSVSIFLLVI
jgi:hypothetical protein